MFIGRHRELQQLKKLISDENTNIGVIFGRRRIGKTALINKALENHHALFFEGLENRSKNEQIKNFLFQLSIQSGQKLKIRSCNTWREAFYSLFQTIKNNPHHLVFDEFQWMANYRSEIVGDLKMIWDQYLCKIHGITLILCGSIASFMTTKVIRSNALYGRTSLTIHLMGFHLPETKIILREKGLEEVLEAQMYLGGVPKYLELMVDGPSVTVAMNQLAFTKNGYFVEEYDRIFTSHFGRNADYRKILETLGTYQYGLFRKELAEKGKLDLGGGLSNLLFTLEAAGFILSETPFNKGHKSRTAKYFLHDPYLRFYFAFVEPNLKKIESGLHQHMFSTIRQSGAYLSWLGRAFEYLCIDHAQKIVNILGFSGIDFSFGPYFQAARAGASGVQIDLLFDRADKVITLCEMKYSQSVITKEVIAQVEKKADYLREKFPSKTIQKVLIGFRDISRDLENAGYFYRIIRADELLSC